MMHRELAFGSKLHDEIRDAVLDRYHMSRNAMSKRHAAWADAEDTFLAYKAPDRDEDEVVVPISYATLLAAHTYWTAVFLGRNPVFQFTARHGEGHQRVQAVEAVVDYQVQVGRMLVPLYLWLLDAGKYGFGVVGCYWDDEVRFIGDAEAESVEYYGVEFAGKERFITRTVRGYTGNRLFNVRPQDWYPDPRVSVLNFQDGEFCARYVEVGWNALLKSSEEYFNLDVLRERWDRLTGFERVGGGSATELPSTNEAPYRRRRDVVGLVEMVWELVPHEHGLGKSKYPEKWVVTVAGGDVVIGCRPLGLEHGQFPYALMAYEMDGYTTTLRGLPELLKPLEDVMSWLFNSHMFNVRKVLNDQLIVDPSRVVMRDLLEGGPGRLVRLNPTAYGSDVRAAVQQLPVADVTAQNIASSRTVLELIQRITGINDNIMGLVNPSGRRTATEVRSSANFGINRLRTFCEFNSALGMAPLAQMVLQNTQQLMPDEVRVRVAGDLLEGDPQYITVNPMDIAGFYDFVPVDGTLPVDRFAQSMLWKEILGGLAQMPQIAASYDIAGIFSWMAQLAGLKNITKFKIQPDAQVAAAQAAGNLVPVGGGNGSSTNAAGGNPQSQIGPLAALGI